MAKPINYFHIILGAVLLILLKKYKSKVTNFKYIFATIGALIAMYHASKYFSTHAWIYLWHVFIVAPSILLLGFYPQVFVGVLQILACAMIGYHTAIIFKLT